MEFDTGLLDSNLSLDTSPVLLDMGLDWRQSSVTLELDLTCKIPDWL